MVAGILTFLLLIFVVVGIHEMGHFLACRAVGVPVSEFSIGLGPRIFGYQGKRTTWSIRAIPLGGYVAMNKVALMRASPTRKIFIAIAGPLANLLPFLILGFAFIGFAPVVTALWDLYWGTITGILGLLARSVDFWHLMSVSKDTFIGPVGMATVTSQGVEQVGFAQIFFLMFLMLSIGIALFNMIPLPPLDGGRIVVAAVEGLLGRRAAERTNNVLSIIGAVVVVWVFLVITFKDVARLF